MRFYKFISVILHPIVIPTIAVMLYFLILPSKFLSNQKLTILSLIFISTYIIPLLVLIFFKKVKLIKSYKLTSIRERKLPLTLMLVVYYVLANTFGGVIFLKDLSTLFYAASLGLFLIFMLFYFNFKTSVHLFSIGIFIGFIMNLGISNSQSFIVLLVVLIILAGLLASARLHLKTHKVQEVYIGLLIGITSSFIAFFLL